MYTMAEKQIDTVLGLVEGTEENKDEKWMCHSQAERYQEKRKT